MKSENFKFVFIFLSAFITFVSCFPSLAKREFPFKDQSYTKLINIDGGDSLVIGSKPTQTVAKDTSRYICTKYTYNQVSYEKIDYKTVVKKAGSPNNNNNYFVLITRAVWRCMEDVAKGAKSKLPLFVRVENDLISIKPIAAVEFYDGVFVSATRYIGERYAVKIKEIKYLQTTTTDPINYETAPMIVVKYDGLIALEEALFPPYQPGLQRDLAHFEAYIPEPQSYYDRCWYDIPDRGEAKDFTLSQNSGRAFAIGTHQIQELIFRVPPCPECFTINPGTPYHSVYRTEVIEFVDSGFEAIMNDEEFSKVFVIASRTVHVCHLPGKSEAEFIRVEQKVIGVAPIRSLRLYSHTITQMTVIEMDAASKTFSAVFTEVKYIQADGSALKQLREIPFRKLFIEKKVSTNIGNVIDIAYLIESADVVSRTLIGNEGYDLRIGETTRLVHMSSYSYEKVWCQEYANTKKVQNEAIGPSWPTETNIFMKVNRDNTFYTLKQITEDRQRETFGKPFYELVQRIIWKCYIGQPAKKSFIRVENRIRVLVPVRELDSYDGVQIFKTRLENGQWSVEIVEVRHLSVEYPHDSIRFSISFHTFNDRRDPSDVIKYSLNNQLSLLKKSGDEMVHTMGAGDGAKKGLNVRDTRPNDADYQPIIKQIGPGRHKIKFNLGVFPHIGNADDIADCDVLQPGSYSDKILPAFTIIDPQRNENVILTSGSRAVHDRVFNDLSAKIWKCTIKGTQSTQFLRVVYDHTLKTNSEYEIGMIEYLQRDEVWLEVKDGRRVVRVRETKYLGIGNYEVLNYQGLHLLTPELSSEWKSGTQIIENYQKISDTVIERESMGKMQYLDDLAHSLRIGDRANYRITIDTRWQKTFGNAGMTLTCQKDLTEGRFTSLETKVRINNEERNIFEEFFEEISIEFWICSDQTNKNGIVRVQHQFLVKDAWKIKEIRHFYGVTIFAGKNQRIKTPKRTNFFTYEIIVIKYHENGANYPIVKYDGKLTFKDYSRTIEAKGLYPSGVRDVYYTLNNRTVYRKQISQLGHTIQVLPFLIGYAASPMDEETKPLIIDCAAFDIGRLTDKNFVLDGIRPRIMWNQNKDGKGLTVRSLMTQEQLNKCFQHHFDIQICGMEVPHVKPIYRVESTLTGTGKCNLAVVYYHDGVTVENYEKLEIKATRFYDNKLQPIKFDGFTRPVPVAKTDGAFREINYLPDVIRATNVTHGSKYGNTYEIGSRWEYELEATADVVKCEKSMVRDYNEEYATKVSFVKEQQLTVVLISILRDSEHFTDVRQTIYNCKRGEQLVFLRVVNEFVENMQTTLSPYIYHHDGVEVGTLVYPDLKRTIKIREVKFVDPKTNKILRYVGELYVVTEMHSIVGRLYDGPASMREEKLEMLAYEKLWPATAMDVYSLDTLRTFIKRMTPDSSLPAVNYQHDNKYWIHINVGYVPGPSVYQVGRLWDEVYVADNRDPLICLQDQWNTQTVFQNYNYKYILPRVIEFYRGKMYELDLHSKRQLISAIGLKVWICANEKDTILRLELSMEIPSANISGYIHPQTVNIWHDQSQEISIIQFRETFYVSASTSKILKYDGELALIKNYITALQVPFIGQPVPRQRRGGLKRFFSPIINCFRPKYSRDERQNNP